MAKIILGATGSVASIRVPDLAARLIDAGHELCVAATEPALHFFTPSELAARAPDATLYRDRDEWPLAPYRREDVVLHIELRKWADVLVVAPLDAHTLAKFANGLCDNLLSCLFRAWDFTRPVVVAPAMNTLMWDSPVTRRHLRTLLLDRAGVDHAFDDLDAAAAVFARHAPRFVLVAPQSKRLACGDVGVGAMADVVAIAERVRVELSDQHDQSAL